MANKIYLGNWKNLDIHKMTNIYLYGTKDTPEDYGDRLRTKEQYENLPEIELDMGTYMGNGPGKYAHAAKAQIVQDFFDSKKLPLGDNSYTKDDLKAKGYTESDFIFSIQHRNIDTESSDYAMRTYIYNNSDFEISSKAVFVVKGDERYIENMAVYARPDNFDFVSQDDSTSAGNKFLQSQIDPYKIGRKVTIDFKDKSAPVIEKYTEEHYKFGLDALEKERDEEPWSIGTDTFPAMLDVIEKLKEKGTIEYETEVGVVKYGSNEDDSISSYTDGIGRKSTDRDVLVAGEGDDILVSDIGNDLLYPGVGNDIVNGGGGIDTVIIEDTHENITGDLLRGGAVIGNDRDRYISIEGVELDGGLSNAFSGTHDYNRFVLKGGDLNIVDGIAGPNLYEFRLNPDKATGSSPLSGKYQGMDIIDNFNPDSKLDFSHESLEHIKSMKDLKPEELPSPLDKPDVVFDLGSGHKVGLMNYKLENLTAENFIFSEEQKLAYLAEVAASVSETAGTPAEVTEAPAASTVPEVGDSMSKTPASSEVPEVSAPETPTTPELSPEMQDTPGSSGLTPEQAELQEQLEDTVDVIGDIIQGMQDIAKALGDIGQQIDDFFSGISGLFEAEIAPAAGDKSGEIMPTAEAYTGIESPVSEQPNHIESAIDEMAANTSPDGTSIPESDIVVEVASVSEAAALPFIPMSPIMSVGMSAVITPVVNFKAAHTAVYDAETGTTRSVYDPDMVQGPRPCRHSLLSWPANDNFLRFRASRTS